MRSIILAEDFSAGDVKPQSLLQRYEELLKADIEAFFPLSERTPVPCPGCGSSSTKFAFERLSFDYKECTECGTIYAAARTGSESISRFYRESDAENYWRQELSRLTADKRRAHVIEPRMDWVVNSTQEHLPDASCLVEVGISQDVAAEAIAQLDRFATKIAIDPLVPCPSPEITVNNGGLAALSDNSVDVVLMFESVDRASDPDALLSEASRVLRPGALLFVTSILGSGFDLQVLWEKADGILPPDRLNLLSVEGWESLLRRHGFDVLEFSTPGMFDVENVIKARAHYPDIVLPRFLKMLADRRDTTDHRRFQAFLQSALLSSYGRICAKKT